MPSDCMKQYDEPTWIAEDSSRHNIFLTLINFLRDDLTSSEADSVSTATVNALLQHCSDGPSLDQYKFESRTLFAILLTIVKQTDAATEQQDRLVSIVSKLRHTALPSDMIQGMDAQSRVDREMNRNLRSLVNVFASLEQAAPLHPPLEDRDGGGNQEEQPLWRQAKLTPTEWTNLNAFIARLHTAEPDVHHLDLRGLFAMIEALEQPLTPCELDDVLPAAAAWVIYAGPQLKSNNIPYPGYPDDGSKRLPWSKGMLWAGQHAFNDERWRFWMSRFREITERTGVSAGVKSACTEAVEAMSSIS